MALLETLEAVQKGEVPAWVQKLGELDGLPERIAEALERADELALNGEGMQVDFALACLALAEATDEKDFWRQEALERLALPGAAESAYLIYAKAWAFGGWTLNNDELQTLRAFRLYWPED